MSTVPAGLSEQVGEDLARHLSGSVYLNRRECARFMNVSEKFLATHLHDGPARLRVGNKVLYRLCDVERWMRQQEVPR